MTRFDFGYPWWLTSLHLYLLIAFGIAALAIVRLRGPRWLAWTSLALALWALIGVTVVRGLMRINAPLTLPTQAFLASGMGRVVDLGAGSGRSALMVLAERPRARVTALDRYEGNYGIADNSPERLHRNARAVGVDDRLDVQIGDMRAMPFGANSYDAAVSAYAIDHLSAPDIDRTLAEASRVLRPGGQFLLMIVNADVWLRLAFPPLPHHAGYFSMVNGEAAWGPRFTRAGMRVVEAGTTVGTFYLLAEKPDAARP